MTKSYKWSNFKAFADDKISVNKELKFVFGRVENIVGKGENAGNQHFFLFPQCFQKLSFVEVFKVGIVWIKVKLRMIRSTWSLVTKRPIPYLDQTSSALRKSPLELLSVLLE